MSLDGVELRFEDRTIGTIFIHLRQSNAEECADLALHNISGTEESSNAISGAIATAGTIGAGGISLWDSGLPQSLVACIPQIDAVVSIIDEAAKVCCLFVCYGAFSQLLQIHPCLRVAWNVTVVAYKVSTLDR